MLHQFPDYSLINRLKSNGHLSANTDFGTDESMEITSPESSPDMDPSSNILPLRGRGISPEQLRILTYVLLGMLVGVLFAVLFIDFHKPVKEAPASQGQEQQKGDSSDESNTTRA